MYILIREMEDIKKSEMELLELKNMSDMKNSLCGVKSRHYRKNNKST